MQVIWYTAMSMDGRIADERNRLDFLETIKVASDSAGGFAEFLTGIDAALVGATTFRWLLDGGHGWPHDDVPTWLMSHDQGLVDRLPSMRHPVRRREGEIGAVFDEIEAMDHRRVWLCGGGAVAAQALAVNRVSEVRVTIAPTVLGAGPALFEGRGLPTLNFLPTACRINGSAVEVTWTREQD